MPTESPRIDRLPSPQNHDPDDPEPMLSAVEAATEDACVGSAISNPEASIPEDNVDATIVPFAQD
ncbi:hypothetical protein F441_07935 [Phytophthora nicotianae CJ01A1]|uniref:Uncharacterized protein n=6 Tax=Phytophthora nicotianae TaxID=4792 RepID=W2QBM4_PHYN3|nr:hypothetical protein PPTG_22804 [Phytophthora nicotianae INRA-310]ETI47902.1 hypothetical protein F443_07964 [Phytophthora nicotianae P1569]ETK87837.1 hypothetical protein L915_07792 [Phytophthora nicotianae]ETO76625.1 hypothetical protein F444_08009 [Phytophthora nicotianae P1976]ETP17717.1 hypothetical protein F441_07935 [Phytophthora nicotianae CJ01A1]ETP45782.1 hypothetical protein F442_07903 [Phytophthora nicotianae P10297]